MAVNPPAAIGPGLAPITLRSDSDDLASKLVELMASGDGVEAGFKTTEFWLTVIAVACDLAAPKLGFNLSSDERMYAAVGLVALYGVYRTWRKNSGPAKLWAETLRHLAELRTAAVG